MVNPILLRKGVRSVAGVPLLDGETVFGVLHVGTLRSRRFDDDDVAMLQLVAGAVNSRRADIERAAAASLQRSLAPSCPATMSPPATCPAASTASVATGTTFSTCPRARSGS